MIEKNFLQTILLHLLAKNISEAKKEERDPTRFEIQQNKDQENFGENKKKMGSGKVIKATFFMKEVEVRAIAEETMVVDAAKVYKRFCRVL